MKPIALTDYQLATLWLGAEGIPAELHHAYLQHFAFFARGRTLTDPMVTRCCQRAAKHALKFLKRK